MERPLPIFASTASRAGRRGWSRRVRRRLWRGWPALPVVVALAGAVVVRALG